MAHFLNIARRVLSEKKEPLSPKEITSIGIKKGWLQTKGLTPWQTMKSKLSTNILNNKVNSDFMRTEQGKFGLRSWKTIGFEEYIAGRFEKAILDERIVVFPKSSLKRYIQGPGLHTSPINNGMSLVHEFQSMMRSEAELRNDFIQLISVFIVKFGSRYLTYKRTKRLPESRLHGFYSIAFGGHVKIDEIGGFFDIFNPGQAVLFFDRELKEELILPENGSKSINYKGLLYDNSRNISKQHLGVVFDVILKSDKYEIGERGFLTDPKFETIDEITARINDFENWSAAIVDFEKNNVRK